MEMKIGEPAKGRSLPNTIWYAENPVSLFGRSCIRRKTRGKLHPIDVMICLNLPQNIYYGSTSHFLQDHQLGDGRLVRKPTESPI